MRAAQFLLPASSGEEAPQLVLSYFGPGQGGTVEANLERWIGQFEQTDGTESRAHAQVETKTVGDLKVTSVRLSGTYVAQMMPGSGPKQNKPDQRLWGLVVEGPGGPWFFKAVGPSAAMKKEDPAFDALVLSFKVSP